MHDAELNVFGVRGEPNAIALAIARALPGAEVKRRRHSYRVSVTSKPGLLRPGRPDLVVEVDARRFGGRDADRERAEVRDDVVRTMRGPGLDTVLGMIPQLRLAVSFLPGDRPVPPIDPIFQVAVDVASRTDGFVLDLYNGRLLSTTGQLWGSTDLLLADGATPVDPSLARMTGRLVALVAVAARALTEYDGLDVPEAREGINAWVRSVGASAELEYWEDGVLRRPAGGLDEADLAHGSWQIEGAVVMAWALDLVDDLPPHDQAVDPTLLSAVVRFPSADETRAVLRSARRRRQRSIDGEAQRHYSIYWRLLEFAANHEALDLESFSRGSPTGPLRFDEVPLLDGDLAVGDRPIADADPDQVDVALGIMAERLRALNWLRRGGTYSATTLEP